MDEVYKSHHRWHSSELYSIGSRNYFGYNGTLFILTKEELYKVLLEVSDMNPQVCAEYLIQQATDKKRFKQISG
jgi:hypothetical protein